MTVLHFMTPFYYLDFMNLNQTKYVCPNLTGPELCGWRKCQHTASGFQSVSCHDHPCDWYRSCKWMVEGSIVSWCAINSWFFFADEGGVRVSSRFRICENNFLVGTNWRCVVDFYARRDFGCSLVLLVSSCLVGSFLNHCSISLLLVFTAINPLYSGASLLSFRPLGEAPLV